MVELHSRLCLSQSFESRPWDLVPLFETGNRRITVKTSQSRLEAERAACDAPRAGSHTNRNDTVCAGVEYNRVPFLWGQAMSAGRLTALTRDQPPCSTGPSAAPITLSVVRRSCRARPCDGVRQQTQRVDKHPERGQRARHRRLLVLRASVRAARAATKDPHGAGAGCGHSSWDAAVPT